MMSSKEVDIVEKKNSRYIVVAEHNLEDLVETVNEKIMYEGYQPRGGTTISNGLFLQVLFNNYE